MERQLRGAKGRKKKAVHVKHACLCFSVYVAALAVSVVLLVFGILLVYTSH